MLRYDNMFKRLDEQNAGAFIPFVILGDPDLNTSLEIIDALVAGGADALELGIPFSDPIADGPTIQAAAIRALENKVTPDDCFELLAQIRQRHPDIPVGLLLYSNLVMAKGMDTFFARCAEVGVDSVLIADIPTVESRIFRRAAMDNKVAPIFIAPPNADEETLKEIASFGRGYTYLVSRAGVTGAETVAEMPAKDLVDKLKHYHAAPPVLGFGISTPEQVKQAIDAGAAGAISGSAVVSIIQQHLGNSAAMQDALTAFVREMKAATQR